MSHPAAWQPDPTGKHDHRWWDGERWTEHVADAGQASIDPIETSPSAPSQDAPSTSPGQDAGEASPGGWAQGATEQGRDPGADAAGAAPAWSQPGAQGGPPAGGDAGQPAGGGPTWQGGGQQPGAPAWQGGGQQPGGPVWQGAGQQPGGPAWQGAGGGAAPGTDGIAIAALVVGILALLVSWFPVVGAIGGIVALVLGLVGRSRIKKRGAGGNGMAVTGIALGVVSIVINLAVLAFFLAAGEGFFDEFGSYVECIEETGDEELCQQQLEDGLFQRFGQ